MKKILVLTLVLLLVFSLAACGGNINTPNSGNNSATPPVSNSGTPDTSTDNGYSLDYFAQISGISSLPVFPDSEISYEGTGSLTVIFTAKSDITDEAFLAYAREVFDICKASSPDGIYDIDYDGYKRGADVPAFPEDNWSGMLMAYWYYTNGDYIAQMDLSVMGNTLTVKINSVYNADTNERAKP